MDELKRTISGIGACDRELMRQARQKLDNLTKPVGSLGRLEDVVEHIVGITGVLVLSLGRKAVFILAADHGVTAEGVSLYPKEVTAQMVYNFLNGGAGINVLARHAGARVVVADFGVAQDLKPDPRLYSKKIAPGTKNMARGAAMSQEHALQAIENGIALFEEEYKNGLDIIGIGEMGIGNTTAASAVTAVMTGIAVEDVTGRGTGIDDVGLHKKIAVIKKALQVNMPDRVDPVDVLAKVGGFEIGGLAGIILAAAARRVPVVLDGFISSSAALIAYGIEPKVREFMIASHRSVEKGHAVILKHLQLNALLELNLRLGEGTGAALAMTIIDAALKLYKEMATFQSAGVSQKE